MRRQCLRCCLLLWSVVACTDADPATRDASAPAPEGGEAAPEPTPAPAPIDADVRRRVIQALAQRLAAEYVFPDVGRQMEAALLQGLEAQAYEAIDDAGELARTLTEELLEIAHDRHLRVLYRPPPPMGFIPPPPEISTGIRRLEVLDGNIGLLALDAVPEVRLVRAAIAGAFAVLQPTAALILDNRNNGGGDPRTAALYVSYLSEGAPIVLNEIHWREDVRIERISSTDVGQRSYGVERPVFVLTSEATFSGGEDLSYTLQALGRARVIGEVTGGGAHPVRQTPLGDQFLVNLPFAQNISPITQSNWEGVGVQPDVPVDAERALDEAVAAAQVAMADIRAAYAARGEPPPLYGIPRARRGEPQPGTDIPVFNGDFSEGLTAWNVGSAMPDAAPVYRVENGVLCVTLRPDEGVLIGWPPETDPYAVALSGGRTHELSFTASSSGPLPLLASVSVGHRLPPYATSVVADMVLDATHQPYTVEFQPDSDDPEGGFAFRLMGVRSADPTATTEFCLDDVALTVR